MQDLWQLAQVPRLLDAFAKYLSDVFLRLFIDTSRLDQSWPLSGIGQATQASIGRRRRLHSEHFSHQYQ